MRNTCLSLIFTCLLFTLQSKNCKAQNKLAFSVPFTLVDNRPFIEVKINGRFFHFIIDSGADYVLDLSTAKTLHLPLNYKGLTGGAGAKQVPQWFTTVNATQIGAVNITNTSFRVTDFSEIKNKLHLPYLDGVIGYTFMRDYAVQFDYPKRVINFYNTYNAVSAIPFTLLYSQIPQINVQIDGKGALVVVDTGDRTAFTIFNHYAIKTGLISNYHLSDTTITGYGIGGPIYARTLSLRQLTIGKTKIANVPSRIPMLTSGFFTDTNNDGSIGGGVLNQYKFTIDYIKEKLYFE